MKGSPFKLGDQVAFNTRRVAPFADEIMIVEGVSRLTLRGKPPVWRISVRAANREVSGTLDAEVLELFDGAASPGDSHERATLRLVRS